MCTMADVLLCKLDWCCTLKLLKVRWSMLKKQFCMWYTGDPLNPVATMRILRSNTTTGSSPHPLTSGPSGRTLHVCLLVRARAQCKNWSLPDSDTELHQLAACWGDSEGWSWWTRVTKLWALVRALSAGAAGCGTAKGRPWITVIF